MRTAFSWLSLLMMFAAAVAAFVINKAAEVAIKEEYPNWAPKVARLLIRIAGWACPSKRNRWKADLFFLQQVEKNSALVEALSCFLTAPFLTATAALGWGPQLMYRVVMRRRHGPSYLLEILRGADSSLRHFPPAHQTVLHKQIVALTCEPRPPGYEAVLADFCRIRVEGYRIVYEVNDDDRLITVMHIGCRRDTIR